MTTQTDLTAQIDRYNRALAEATKECPLCAARDKHLASLGRKVDETIYCAECEGNRDSSGRVARFPWFRQKCDKQWMVSPVGKLYPGWIVHNGWSRSDVHGEDCICNSLGWQVRAGDSADALAGLTVEQFYDVLTTLREWTVGLEWHGPVPPAPEIRAKELELVCKVAGLTVLQPCES